MNIIMRGAVGGAILGVGLLAWRRRGAVAPAGNQPDDAAATGPVRSKPTERSRSGARRAASPPPQAAAQPQDLDGGVTVAITGHNPGMHSMMTPSVDELGLADAAAGLSPNDIDIYGSVIEPIELDAAGVIPAPGDEGPDGRNWTDAQLASVVETGVEPGDDEPVLHGRDDDDDIPVADRGSGGLGGL